MGVGDFPVIWQHCPKFGLLSRSRVKETTQQREQVLVILENSSPIEALQIEIEKTIILAAVEELPELVRVLREKPLKAIVSRGRTRKSAQLSRRLSLVIAYFVPGSKSVVF
jgi:hypothetical protein